ncbi:MAG: acylphosphatase [Candidatus Bipolaricaulota bacterium]|nr:acylphosphatase [Candidatus Bipolaricaulota bacterium]MCX7844842.1 acylphosphatase [Candidatus Bipolaricaulota bacterium]MDW8151332.1 acylphosphatase [Candidatus Bipolaricaulota bacterium]
MKRVHLFVSGRVQGVFFRAHTRDLAQRLGLTGFVRNLPDGRVEVVAEGPEEKLQELVAFCHRGPPLAHVTGVEVRWEEPTGEFRGFSVR